MNLDEFLDDLAAVPTIGWENKRKLIALVRKLREQRDEAFTELANALEGAGPSRSDMAKANAALDEIVRGG